MAGKSTKLSDLGCATLFGDPKEHTDPRLRPVHTGGLVRDTVGTPAFLAPECHTGTCVHSHHLCCTRLV